jgi:phage terminase small subunit
MGENVSKKHKKPRHGKVAAGQMALLPEEMGYDTCELDDPRHEVFCREYALTKNGTKAYARAFPGCKQTTARANASGLLAIPDIVARIREVRRERLDRLEVTHEKIIQELAKMAFLDPRAFYRPDGSILPVCEMDPDAAATLEGLKIRVVEESSEEGIERRTVVAEIKHASKRAALELLMRHREMITDRLAADVNHSGAVAVSDDLEKLEKLRAKFTGGMAHGAVDSAR